MLLSCLTLSSKKKMCLIGGCSVSDSFCYIQLLHASLIMKGYGAKCVFESIIPAGIYMLKVNNRNTRSRCKIWSKLTIKIPERRHCRRSGVFIVNFEHISHLDLVFLLLNLIGKCRLGCIQQLIMSARCKSLIFAKDNLSKTTSSSLRA